MNGSRYIQNCLQQLSNSCKVSSNSNNDTFKQEILDFFTSIAAFGHLLCIDKYGHYAIDKLLTICHDYQIVDVLQQFTKIVIIKHFRELMEHSYPCRIIQNMLNSHCVELQMYSLQQLNSILKPNGQQATTTIQASVLQFCVFFAFLFRDH